MVEIVKGEYYFLYEGVIRVFSIENDYSEGRSYASGDELDLRLLKLRDPDLEGHQLSNIRIWNSGPLTEKQKKDIIAKFAKVRRKGVAKKFFHMR